MTYATEIAADGPIAWYRLGDTSGTTMTDSSGNGRNGTYVASPTLGVTGLVPGDSDKAVTFSSIQWGQVPTAAWQDLGSFTLEAIIKPGAVSSGNRGFISKRATSSDSTIHWGVRTSAAQVSAYVKVNGVTYNLTGLSNNLTTSNPYLVTVTFDQPTGLFSLYINGGLDASMATVAGGTTGGTTSDLWIGRGYASAEAYGGTLDEAQIYDKVLSAARILARFNVLGLTTSSATDRVSREHGEVLHEVQVGSRVSREHAEVLHESHPDVRVSREHAEVLHEMNPDRRVSRVHAEVLHPVDPNVRVYWHFVEVLYSLDINGTVAGRVPALTGSLNTANVGNVAGTVPALRGTLSSITGAQASFAGVVPTLTSNIDTTFSAALDAPVAHADLKVGLMLDGSPQRSSAEHIKVMASIPGNLTNYAEHVKVTYYGVSDVREAQAHVKVGESQPGDRSIAHAHTKVAESQPGNLFNSHEHLKTGQKGAYPVLEGSTNAKVAYMGVALWDDAQNHAKAGVQGVGNLKNAADHLKVLAVIQNRSQTAQSHVKVLARTDNRRHVAAEHIKVASPFGTRRRKGWGIIL